MFLVRDSAEGLVDIFPNRGMTAAEGGESRILEALVLLRQGKSNQQIADAMGILKRTVENTISSIYLKTGVASREELMEM